MKGEASGLMTTPTKEGLRFQAQKRPQELQAFCLCHHSHPFRSHIDLRLILGSSQASLKGT